ncbi:hypothetical protein AAFF_G00030910 [Aldrovandia affinis]|uniref:Uncharacterized protein n=1 Tax=Aldrovandia affinis TaxID=143900 RepID=A0AAD7WGD5_9TELE|nr:hypothetical protein AAFF_G00030910 [Aldrovandia affinis]
MHMFRRRFMVVRSESVFRADIVAISLLAKRESIRIRGKLDRNPDLQKEQAGRGGGDFTESNDAICAVLLSWDWR